jgi:hypothetical protein
MKLAAAWTERFTSRRDVGHFLAWLPGLREFQLSEKSDASRLEQSVQKRTLKFNGWYQLGFN